MKQKYRILIISDIPILRSYSLDIIKQMCQNIDFILGAGDLSNDYLDFVLSTLDKRLIYINGNHIYNPDHHIPFCENIDQKFTKIKGLKIFGLDGSPIYSCKEHQYSESQVGFMILRNIFSFLIKKPDIILSHTPPFGIHDLTDPPHVGFKWYKFLIKYFPPKLWIHGHTHLNHHHEIQETIENGARIVNAYGFKIIELEV